MNNERLCILKPKTNKAKNRIAQFGSEWIIENVGNPICLNGNFGYFVRSNNGVSVRWIAKTNDSDFDIVLVSD